MICSMMLCCCCCCYCYCNRTILNRKGKDDGFCGHIKRDFSLMDKELNPDLRWLWGWMLASWKIFPKHFCLFSLWLFVCVGRLRKKKKNGAQIHTHTHTKYIKYLKDKLLIEISDFNRQEIIIFVHNKKEGRKKNFK